MEGKKSFWWHIQNLDTRITHTLIFLLILLPLMNPIGLPLQISKGTQMAFDALEAIPAGSRVLFSYEMASGNEAELLPTCIAWLHQLMAKRCKIVTFAIYTQEGPVWAQQAFDQLKGQYNYEYGKDYVIMPYTAGMETALAAIGRDIHSVFPEDHYKNKTADLPLMQEITGMSDFSMLLKSSGWNPDLHVRQLVTVYGIPMVANCTGIVAPGAQAYLSAGQIKGLVAALAGAAEYEILIKKPGAAAAAMDAQSTTHALVITLVLLGNVGMYVTRAQAKGKGGR